jgi:CDGSH-type Zn-finger protein
MANVKIQALDNGPFLVSGKVEVVDGKGEVMEVHEEGCHLCRCGLSKNQPYCSGAHQGEFKDEVRKK